MEKVFYGPLWVLPVITVAVAHTGVELGTGLAEPTETTEYQQFAAKGLIISCPSSNTGDCYLVTRASDGTYSRLNSGTVVMVIAKGTVQQLPQAEYGGNRYLMNQLGIDADNNDDQAFCTGIMQ